MSSNLFVGQCVIKLAIVDSTNNYARALIRDKMPIEGTVIIADSQTGGRGQRSNSWSSEPGLNLTCSYILNPAFLSATNQFALSATVALSVFDTIRKFAPSNDVKIKWPNDILIGDRKIAGILIENSLKRFNLDTSIVGIGINVNQNDFDSNLNATSIKKITNQKLDLEDVLKTLNENLEKHYLRLRNGKGAEIINALNENLFRLGENRLLSINGEEETVQILGTSVSGELKLLRRNGETTLHQHHEIDWNLNP
mgnify:CR=1 FL=1